jgi:hypothetical protein
VFRLAFLVVLAIVLTVCGATVKLGKRTFFGHVSAIWNTEEAQDARDGIKPVVDDAAKKAKKVGDKVAPVVKKTVHELTEERDAGAAPKTAPKPKPGPGTSKF